MRGGLVRSLPRSITGLKTGTIRQLDAILGTVLCFLLTVWRRVADTLRPMDLRAPPRRVVFIKLIEQGATVLAAPAIRRAIRRVGRENVYFCVFTENRPILDLLDLVAPENVIPIRSHGLVPFALDTLRGLRQLRRAGVDAAIDLEFMARAPAVLAYLTGARLRVGLHRFTAEAPYRGDLMTHRVQYNPYLHTAEAYALLVDALDCDPTDAPLPKVTLRRADEALPKFNPRAEEVAHVHGLLEGLAGRPVARPIVVINPNTGDVIPLRMWPAERFVELGRQILARRPEATVVVTGLATEHAGAEDVCRRIGSDRAVCVAGMTTLRELVTLYTQADVLVASDSGPGHFAALTDIDAVVLFGPETPALFSPRGGRAEVLWAGLACSPCVNPYNHRFSACTRNACMDAHTVEAVLAATEARLDARAARDALADAPVNGAATGERAP